MLPDGNFCERLEGLLKSKGISAEDLARMSGLNATSVSRYRSGAREPTASGLLALAVALGVTMEWLLTGSPLAISGSVAGTTAAKMLEAAKAAAPERIVLNDAPAGSAASYQEVSALREENQRLRDIIAGVRALVASEPLSPAPARPVTYRTTTRQKSTERPG